MRPRNVMPYASCLRVGWSSAAARLLPAPSPPHPASPGRAGRRSSTSSDRLINRPPVCYSAGVAPTENTTLHGVRREAFLDVAQRLVETKGYEAMSIQDVLDALEVSKGAFYHYFHSKQALLEAVVERL